MKPGLFHKIQLRLISEEKLPVPYAAVMAATALFDFDPALRSAVEQWAAGESVANCSLKDTSVQDIRNEIGGSEFQAMCVLNLVARYPSCFENAVLNLHHDQVRIARDDPAARPE